MKYSKSNCIIGIKPSSWSEEHFCFSLGFLSCFFPQLFLMDNLKSAEVQKKFWWASLNASYSLNNSWVMAQSCLTSTLFPTLNYSEACSRQCVISLDFLFSAYTDFNLPPAKWEPICELCVLLRQAGLPFSDLFQACVRVLQAAVFAFCLHLKWRWKLSLRWESVRSKFIASEFC